MTISLLKIEQTNSIAWKNLRTTLLFLICIAAITTNAMAADPNIDTTKARVHGVRNLTGVQKTKIGELQNQMRKEMLPISNVMDEKRAHLRTLETAEKTDMAAINSTIDELQNLKTKLLKLQAASKQEIRKQLTPEQRLEFDLRSQNEGGREHHKGGKYGHRGKH